MQCPSCSFENMPGSDGCARCGSALNVGTMLIDVKPPRAGRAARSWRRMTGPAQRQWRMRRQSAAAQRVLRWTEFWRLIVPGWMHLRDRQLIAGRVFLYSYLILAAAGILLFGSSQGNFYLGLAAAVHVTSVFDIIRQQLPPDRPAGTRFVLAMAITWFMLALLYFPMFETVMTFARPVQLAWAAGPLDAGDVVLVNQRFHRERWLRPGQIVLYNAPDAVGDMRRDFFTAVDGDRLDRIVATAGDHVSWRHGGMTINGRPTEWYPLNPGALPNSVDVDVPPDCVLIFPSVGASIRMTREGLFWTYYAIVPRDRVLGEVFWRCGPLARFGPVH